jgi:hypothetical protein
MNQGDLFEDEAATTALVRGWVVPCVFGDTGVGWLAGHHCLYCWLRARTLCHEFDAAVARGDYDQRGRVRARRSSR